jgi:tRNA (uracil-5-)-methyltransferase
MKETFVKTAVRSFTKQVKLRCENVGLTCAWTDPKDSCAPHGCGCPLDPIISGGVDGITGYRNKCEFTIGNLPEGAIECGFVLKITGEGGQLVSSAEEVPHVPAVMKKLCCVVREHVKASPFAVLERNRCARGGVWRLVMVRQSTKGELLLMVQIASVADDVREQLGKAFVEAMLAANLSVASVFLQENDTTSDAAPADARLFHIHGRERLEMTQLGLRFEIGPLSFFQTNSATCELLYERALSWLRPAGGIVLDICCGVGTIGLCAASRCKRMVGLELVPEAVVSARQNAALNGIANASFHVGKAEHVLPKLLPELLAEEGENCEVCAMVDPPRAGLHKDVLTALRECTQLSRMVYISCNPESLAEDVVKLCTPKDDEDPLMPVRAVAVDMFPHTVHCEMILLLERTSKVRLRKDQPSESVGEASQ